MLCLVLAVAMLFTGCRGKVNESEPEDFSSTMENVDSSDESTDNTESENDENNSSDESTEEDSASEDIKLDDDTDSSDDTSEESSEDNNWSEDTESENDKTNSSVNDNSNEASQPSEDKKNNSSDEDSKPSGDKTNSSSNIQSETSKPSEDKTNSSDNTSNEDSKPSDDTDSSNDNSTNEASKPDDDKTDSSDNSSATDKEDKEEEKIDGEITKSDANALTTKSALLNGVNNEIKGFKIVTEKPVAFNLVEFEMEVPKSVEGLNVYKESEVDINIEMVGSNGKTISTEAFYYEEYTFTEDMQLIGKNEEAEPCFKFRVSPNGAGTWDFTVTLSVKGKVVDTLKSYINVAKDEDGSQVLKVEPVRKQTFITNAGEHTVLVGENICWNTPNQHTTRFGQYVVDQMEVTAGYGANHTRIWDTYYSGSKNRAKVHEMNQSAGAMWDYVFDSAEDLGMYVTFVLLNHGELSQYNTDRHFDSSIWHVNNGGYLTDSNDFWTSRETMDALKTYLRYVISRWGYSEYIMTWEICNEIDHAFSVTQTNDVREWLKEVAAYIREKDPYKHMVSCSPGKPDSSIGTYNIFDFMYYHYYNYESITSVVNDVKAKWLQYKKPFLFGEWGVSGDFRESIGGESISDDLTIVHHGNWLGVMGGGAGTGMNWYWHELDEKGGQWTYQVVSEIAEEIPWDDPNMYMVNTTTASPSNDQIEALGYRGKDYAYIWFYDEKYTVKNRTETTFENETAKVKLDDGTYHIRWVDTWTGMSVKKEVKATNNGYLEFEIPTFTKDIVVAITVD